jgi:hypothetical protein
MNIQFADKLAATAFHNCMHREMETIDDPVDRSLTRFVFNKFTGNWCDYNSDFPDDIDPRVLWNQQSGRMATLIIGVVADAIYRSEQGDLFAKEFCWAIKSQPVDKYGSLDRSQLEQREINGGLFNHGTHDAPDWGSHT